MSTLYYESNELYHHGVKGQKWGVRRYQNADGSLNSDGLKRYKKLSPYATATRINRDVGSSNYNIRKDTRALNRGLKKDYKSGNISKNEYKRQVNSNNANSVKEQVTNLHNGRKNFAQSTSRGKNIAAGTMGIVGGISVRAASYHYAKKGKAVTSLALASLSGTMIGMGAVDLMNESIAKRYR